MTIAAAGLVSVLGTACGLPDNQTSLGWGDVFEAPAALFIASEDDLSGKPFDFSVAFLFAPNTVPLVLTAGQAGIDIGEGGIAALAWFLQEPNGVSRSEEKVRVRQLADVVFEFRLYDNEEDFFVNQPRCVADPILLGTCSGHARAEGVANDFVGPGRFGVFCPNVNVSLAAAAIDDSIECFDDNGGPPSEEEIEDMIDMFLSDGKLKIFIDDDEGEFVVPEYMPIPTLSD